MSQENRVMKIEIDKYKIQVGTLQEEIRRLRQASVNIQARAEQEEEYISNTLLKKIEELKKEKVERHLSITLIKFYRKR
jgi:coiled-coil domain-containing protein 6